MLMLLRFQDLNALRHIGTSGKMYIFSVWNMEYVMNESFDLCGFGQEYVIILVGSILVVAMKLRNFLFVCVIKVSLCIEFTFYFKSFWGFIMSG